MIQNCDALDELLATFELTNSEIWQHFCLVKSHGAHEAHVALQSQFEGALHQYVEALEDGDDQLAHQAAVDAYVTALLWAGFPISRAYAWANLMSPPRRRRLHHS